jgi:competence protein ComEC
MTVGALGSTVEDRLKGQPWMHGLAWPSLTQIMAWVQAQLETQRAHLMLYAPFFLLFGNWLYFSLYFEPPAWLTATLVVISFACFFLRRFSTTALLIGIFLLGFSAAKLRELEVATPMVRGSTNGVILGGWIANFSDRANNARMLEIVVDDIEGVPDDEHPRRVRLYATDSTELQVGDYIAFNAYLSPLPRPVTPGGFDYSRNQFFSSIGAGGRIIGKPEVIPVDMPMQFEYRRVFRQLRAAINARIDAVIPGALGHFGASMVTGDRFGIGDEVTQSVQISGLAHMIGVAGLHMSIVGGFVFWAVRALLALSPRLALHYPIKKWAAVAGLLVCLLYMLLADAGSRTERSFIMTATMFIAILLDRPGMSLRNLAISAIIVLLLTPEESLGASFQMSYLAVMAIIAFHGAYRNWRKSHPHHFETWKARVWSHIKEAVIRGAGISIVSGAATGIAAGYQFGRLSPYTVFANGFALPVAEVAVLPPAVVAVAAMPFGLEYVPLKVMQFGLWFTMLISDWIGTWPGANLMVAKPNTYGIIVMVMGAGLVCVGAGRLRLMGWPIMLLGLAIGSFSSKPILIIEDRASNVAMMDDAHHYVLANTKNKFATGKWLQDNGEQVTSLEASNRPGWDCASGDCFSTSSPFDVSFLQEKSHNGLYCPPTPVIIADFPLHHQCRDAKLVIDRIDVWRNGAYAVYREGDNLRVETARAEQGLRPWVYESRKGIKKPSALPTTTLAQQ